MGTINKNRKYVPLIINADAIDLKNCTQVQAIQKEY